MSAGPALDAVVGGQPVTANIGGDSHVGFSATAWLHQTTDNDPVDDNNSSMLITEFAPLEVIFIDSYEIGDTTSWSGMSP